jgi:hypothetical protein
MNPIWGIPLNGGENFGIHPSWDPTLEDEEIYTGPRIPGRIIYATPWWRWFYNESLSSYELKSMNGYRGELEIGKFEKSYFLKKSFLPKSKAFCFI